MEQAPHGPETLHEHKEHEASHEHVEKPVHHQENQPEHHKDSIEAIQKKVEATARKSHETPVDHVEREHDTPFIGEGARRDKLKQTLGRIRKRLPARDRALSKVIHQPVINAVSEVGARTVARPSGILVGAFFALIGSTALLYISKQNGFEYNYLLLFVFFGGGFVIGLFVELVARVVKR